MSSPFKIAIVGAGPVGSLLARLLVLDGKDDREVTVFESDASPNFRKQGGTLDLHHDTGIFAIKKAQLFHQFERHARYDADDTRFCDAQLNCYFHLRGAEFGEKAARPEIDRVRLRQIIVESLPEGVIQWGRRLSEVTEDNILRFKDGSQAGPFDFIVGAEGVWSRVRRHLHPSHPGPEFSNYRGLHYSIPDAETKVPELLNFVGKGSIFAQRYHQHISMQQLGDGSLRIGALDYYETDDPVDKTPSVLREQAVERHKNFSPLIQEALAAAPDDVTWIAIYSLPRNYRWPTNPRITLAGDAAHCMPPFAGEGVNIGLKDAAVLADTLEEIIRLNKTDAPASSLAEKQTALLDAYEKNVAERATAARDVTFENMYDMEDPNTPASTMPSLFTRYALRALFGEWRCIRAIFWPLMACVMHLCYPIYRRFLMK